MLISRRILKSLLTASLATAVSTGAMSATADDAAAEKKPAEAASPESGDEAAPIDHIDANRVNGQIMIVTPDGKRHMVPLQFLNQGQPFHLQENGESAPLMQWLAEHGDVNPAELTPPKYVIGVGVGEVPEYVWEHLKRPGQKGLVVAQVMPDSPALAAGLKPHDLLLKANDRDLVDQKTLTDVVQESAEKPITLLVLRAGEEQTIEVTPKKNEVVQRASLTNVPQEVLQNRVHRLGPGLLIEPESNMNDLRQELNELRKQMDSLQKAIEDMKSK